MTGVKRPSWNGYRRRRRLFWVAFLGYLPVCAFLGTALSWVFGSTYPVALLALAWLGFFAFAGIRMNSFPCPRCRKPFFHTGFAGNPLVQRCMRCGWPKWVERIETGTAAPDNPPLERTGAAV